MPTPIPNKLPRVVGQGKLARAFGLTWTKINEVIDAVQGLQPMASSKTRVNRTSIGFSVEQTGTTTTSSSGDGTARWA
jgi:hypothetical protein